MVVIKERYHASKSNQNTDSYVDTAFSLKVLPFSNQHHNPRYDIIMKACANGYKKHWNRIRLGSAVQAQ
jgi:predicted lipoprotein